MSIPVRISGPLLDKLGGDGYPCGHIFNVYRKSNDTFELVEACDGYFHEVLTPYELLELGRELIEAAEAVGFK